jgi:putative addiction module component (TIGR02574 family)
MTLKADEIEAEALKLSPDARARLAERLLRSLEGLSDEENEALWIREAQRRNQEMDAGSTVGRPAEEVFRDARSRLS